MTPRTWIGGHDGNDAGSAANWSPGGAPQRGDTLTVVDGTLEISRTDLAGDVLHLTQDFTVAPKPVVLDLSGNARVGIDGSHYGAQINVVGEDRLDAAGGLSGIFGTIDLAAHSHLVFTGQLNFVYGTALVGDSHSTITNNGSIMTENGNVSVPVDGHGTLGFSGYHDGMGRSTISAPISGGQTVQLDPHFFGMQLTLTDPSDFHGQLDIVKPTTPVDGDIEIKLDLKADGLVPWGNHLFLFDAGRLVDALNVHNAGAVPMTASFAPDATTLVFHTAHA